MYRQISILLKRESLACLLFSVACAIALVCIQVYVIPLRSALTVLDGRIHALYTLAGEKKDFSELLTMLGHKKDTLSSFVRTKNINGADTLDMNGLLSFLIDQAHVSGIEFVKMLPQVSESSKPTVGYPIVLEMNVPYNALGSFVASLERNQLLLRIDRVAILEAKSQTVSARMLVTCFAGRGAP